MRRLPIQSFINDKTTQRDQSWEVTNLNDGLRWLHVHSDDIHFQVGAMLNAGSRFESTTTNGISHFLEHMMFRGCEKFPAFGQFAREFEWLGAEWNAETAHEYSEYWVAGLKNAAGDMVRLFAEFLQHPVFADIEIERKIILRELEGELNEFDNNTDTEQHISELIWGEHSLALPILGSKETIKSIGIEDLQAFRTRMYRPDRMIIYTAGGDQAEVGAIVKEAFAGYCQVLGAIPSDSSAPDLVSPTTFTGPAVRWVEDSDNEYEVQISFQCMGENSSFEVPYDLIARILSDGFSTRLQSRIREELGLVYELDADVGLHTDTGTFDITASIRGDQVAEFFKELFSILANLRDKGPGDDEVEIAKIKALTDNEAECEYPASFASSLAWSTLTDRPYSLTERREQILGCSRGTLHDLCRSIFIPANLAIVGIGPQWDKGKEPDLSIELLS